MGFQRPPSPDTDRINLNGHITIILTVTIGSKEVRITLAGSIRLACAFTFAGCFIITFGCNMNRNFIKSNKREFKTNSSLAN